MVRLFYAHKYVFWRNRKIVVLHHSIQSRLKRLVVFQRRKMSAFVHCGHHSVVCEAAGTRQRGRDTKTRACEKIPHKVNERLCAAQFPIDFLCLRLHFQRFFCLSSSSPRSDRFNCVYARRIILRIESPISFNRFHIKCITWLYYTQPRFCREQWSKYCLKGLE